MTVINPNSISGITSITMPSGDGNVLTVHTNDGTERFRIDSSGNVKIGTAATISPDGDLFVTGVCTATTLSGAASGLTGALPAIDGSALTGIAATDNVRTGILDVAGIATFRNDVNIGAAVTISESGIEASGIGITCANINGGQISGRRNIIINGAMKVAQRGTSATSNGYHVIDRFQSQVSGADESPTFSQVDVASGTPAYQSGFRKAFKITNGNQTSGAGAADRAEMAYKIEAQDLANSGWNYTSSSSFVTLSFWIKSSVAQNFYGRLLTADGTGQRYAFETGSLTADTWTKVTRIIPGNSNLQFDNNTEEGLKISWYAFLGTDYTDSSSLNTWAAGVSGNRTPDQTSTWWTTNDSTLELTGVQLEAGSQATPFEHLSFHEDYLRCARYYIQMNRIPVMTNRAAGNVSTTTRLNPVPMRAIPTVAASGTISLNVFFYGDTAPTSTTTPGFQNNGDSGQPYGGDNMILNFSGFSTGTFQTNEMGEVYGATFSLSAEL